jgi:hypothetical protein
MRHAERGLNLSRDRGESEIRRRGRDNDEIDVRRGEAGIGKRRARRVEPQGGGCLILRRYMPLLDAGALHDPVIRRIDDLFEVGIGEDPRG